MILVRRDGFLVFYFFYQNYILYMYTIPPPYIYMSHGCIYYIIYTMSIVHTKNIYNVTTEYRPRAHSVVGETV